MGLEGVLRSLRRVLAGVFRPQFMRVACFKRGDLLRASFHLAELRAGFIETGDVAKQRQVERGLALLEYALDTQLI